MGSYGFQMCCCKLQLLQIFLHAMCNVVQKIQYIIIPKYINFPGQYVLIKFVYKMWTVWTITIRHNMLIVFVRFEPYISRIYSFLPIYIHESYIFFLFCLRFLLLLLFILPKLVLEAAAMKLFPDCKS